MGTLGRKIAAVLPVTSANGPCCATSEGVPSRWPVSRRPAPVIRRGAGTSAPRHLGGGINGSADRSVARRTADGGARGEPVDGSDTPAAAGRHALRDGGAARTGGPGGRRGQGRHRRG